MSCLPAHGRVKCTRCYPSVPNPVFNKPARSSSDDAWRIRANPLAWGNVEPEIVVLGFSKGPKQVCALSAGKCTHEDIAFKESLTQVGKILAHIGAMCPPADGNYRKKVFQLICQKNGRCHFGSLVRCSVERFDINTNGWEGWGNNMLDGFMESAFGKEVAGNCAKQHLEALPARTRLVVLFGLGSELKYVQSARTLIDDALPGELRPVNEVAYTDGRVTFVHVEHFKSQGSHIPDWLGEKDKNSWRANLGRLARDAAKAALAN